MSQHSQHSRNDSFTAQASDFEEFYNSHASPYDRSRQCLFRNIDQTKDLHAALDILSGCAHRNFLMDFSDQHVWAGFDLTAETIVNLVRSGSWPGESSTRWIDISFPSEQRELLDKLARHYDFSPRMLSMMISRPRTNRQGLEKSQTTSFADAADKLVKTKVEDNSDVENAMSASELASISSKNPARTGNLYELLHDVWHYTSVEQGTRYLSLGYNSIYSTSGLHIPYSHLRSQTQSPLPDCIRAWTWLLLCDDKTVISINEDIFPDGELEPTPQEHKIVLRTRQNLFNVFRSLSKAYDPGTSSLNLLPIRLGLSSNPTATLERSSDAPGLLFYFLFESWFNSYALITKRDSRYNRELTLIRKDMFKQPSLEQIDRLDKVGGELGVLERHFRSYIQIIDRILEGPARSHGKLNMSTSQYSADLTIEREYTPNQDFDSQPIRIASLLGVNPGPAATIRFERLKDMISLYALSEVQEYLARKQNMVEMNFQLIAIRQSRDVDKLTRVSLFITKATVLFLPVSLMTSYFGTNLMVTNYLVSTYWFSFIGILLGSYLVLLGFGVVSGDMESWPLLSWNWLRVRFRRWNGRG